MNVELKFTLLELILVEEQVNFFLNFVLKIQIACFNLVKHVIISRLLSVGDACHYYQDFSTGYKCQYFQHLQLFLHDSISRMCLVFGVESLDEHLTLCLYAD